MPGQGYHDGMLIKVCERIGRNVTDELKVGDYFPDAPGIRRYTHYCGGAGAVYPRYTELRQCENLQTWDSGLQKSHLVDPKIDMRLFEAVNKHIPEGDYKDGIRIHLIVDREYDKLVQTQLFVFSQQKDNIVVVRATGEKMDGPTFRKALYASYPMLDQYLFGLTGKRADDVEKDHLLLRATMTDKHADTIIKYLNYNPDFVWKDTEFFTKEIIDALIENTVKAASQYLK